MCVDWQKLNMTVVGEATSGLEALDLVDELMPNIVITDIQMPYMDGLSLSKTIKERYPDISIMILTAHDEFSYAQRAVSIGVSEFILKPINKDLLAQTLARMGDKIISNRLKLSKLELSQQYIENNINTFQYKMLNDLISGNPDMLSDYDELSMLNINFNMEYDLFQVGVVNIPVDKSKCTTLEYQLLLHNC